MILVTCTIATFVAQKGAINISLRETADDIDDDIQNEKILMPLSNPENVEELVQLSTTIKSKDNKTGLYALSIINNSEENAAALKQANKLLDKAVHSAAATDVKLNRLIRYDLNVINGISGVIHENNITDLILGLHVKKGISDGFLGTLTEGILSKNNVTTFIYKPAQPISTIKNQVIIIPKHAEIEIGFTEWLLKVWNIGRNTGAKMIFYASEKITGIIKEIHAKHSIEAEFRVFDDWEDFLVLLQSIKQDEGLIIVMSREKKPSYQAKMRSIPAYLNSYFASNNFILIYPMQTGVLEETIDLTNASLIEPIEKIDELGKKIARLFRRK